jgi:hypothetical protein
MKVIFFSLNAAIWEHALPESRLIRELNKNGHDVTFVTCDKALSTHCTSMEAYGLELSSPMKQKNKVCSSCNKNANLLTNQLRLKNITLKSHIDDLDENLIDDLIAGVTQENYLTFSYLNVPIGRIATYEPFLKHKKMSTELSATQWSDYQIHLKNCLQSLISFKRIYDKEHPDKLFIYSPQYGCNGVAAEYAINNGSQVYFIEGSSNNAERYKALRIWNWDEYRLLNPALNYYKHIADYVSQEDVLRVKPHLSELYKGNSFAVFSAAHTIGFDVREYFQIPSGNKVVLAALSSFDEAYSAYLIGGFHERKVKSPVFENQFEWIRNTIKYFETKPEYSLIIRIHPRDYPNKREKVTSEQARVWQEILVDLPENIIVNSPDQNISIYDLLKQIDVLLTGWSATAIEAMLHGVPAVTYDDYLPSYPKEIYFSGHTRDDYYSNIDKAIVAGVSNQNMVNAFRWLAVSFSIGTVRMNPIISIGNSWSNRPLPRFIKRMLRYSVGSFLQKIDVNRPFGNEIDRQRFLRLIKEEKSCLYDVLMEKDANKLDDKQLAKIVGNL